MDKECAPAPKTSAPGAPELIQPATAPRAALKKKKTTLACVGPTGSFAWFAAGTFAASLAGEDVSLLPAPDLESIFRLIDDGLCSSALIPMENSRTGGAGPAIDLFLRHDLRISVEYSMRADICLLSRERNTDAIRVIYSHPRHLARCAGKLAVMFPDAATVATASDTEAAHFTAQMDGAAALGHPGLAGQHGLAALGIGIQSNADVIRFIRIERRDANAPSSAPCAPEDAISSLLFTLPDSPGALASVFQCLAEAGVSVRKLEMRPLDQEHTPDNLRHAFFAELETDLSSPAHARTMNILRAVCADCRLLGCYPRAAEV
ncbi:hypothetical protein LJC23_04890 [Desulfovibrio sp. OttesenSCG-928-I05]|nr:hypothetical protein [Desulfovibrio sp. OttesenSCG-928-I05]